jgi:hypothetical protein
LRCGLLGEVLQEMTGNTEPKMAAKPKSRFSPTFVIVMTLFIDAIGYGIIIPLLPFYTQTLQAGSAALGVLVASSRSCSSFFLPSRTHIGQCRAKTSSPVFNPSLNFQLRNFWIRKFFPLTSPLKNNSRHRYRNRGSPSLHRRYYKRKRPRFRNRQGNRSIFRQFSNISSGISFQLQSYPKISTFVNGTRLGLLKAAKSYRVRLLP